MSSVRTDGRVARDFACGGCGAQLLHQAEATAILDELAGGDVTDLGSFVRSDRVTGLAVYHVGTSGPVRTQLSVLEDYEESVHRPDLEPGALVDERSRRSNQDHQRLTHPDGRWDLMVSSHVLEHVPVPARAFAEAYRTLRPGGRYVFSVPGRRLRARSVTRAELRGGEVVHLHPPQYHRSPEGKPALVFTVFGADVLDQLAAAGFVATIRRPHRSIQGADRNFVVVALKPPAAAAH